MADPVSQPRVPEAPPTEAPDSDLFDDSSIPLGGSLVTRREALRRVTAMLGGVALVGAEGFLTGCAPSRAATEGPEAPGAAPPSEDTFEFSDANVAFLDEIAETILPDTSTPGAKAAATGAFMALAVRDMYSVEERDRFVEGMRRLDEECVAMNGRPFMQASPPERLALLERLDREQYDHTEARDALRRGEPSSVPGVDADSPTHYFRMMKELALLGYFTSEIGYHQAQRYVETPGRFDPCVPYEPGDRAWAPHA